MNGAPSRSRISLRGSHLDSATYRAVLRLLAHCVQVQSIAPPVSPCVSPSLPAHGGAVASRGELSCLESEEAAAVFGGRSLGAEEGRERPGAESGIRGRSDDPVGLRSSLGDSALEVIPACVDGLGREEIRGEHHDDSRHASSSALPSDFPQLHDELKGAEEADGSKRDSDGLTFAPSSEGAKFWGSSEVHLPANSADQRGEGEDDISDDWSSGQRLSRDDSQILPSQSGNTCAEQEPSTAQPEIGDSAAPSTNGSEFEEFGERNQTASPGAIGDNEMEEGEIADEIGVSDHAAGDVELLENALQEVDHAATAVNLSRRGASTSIYQDKETTSITIREPNQAEKIKKKLDQPLESSKKKAEGEIQREENASETKVVKVREKTKRAPLTESRKEKKKLAKKRKRAETNKKLGVKRLKLEMPVKTVKVIPCSFYRKGRCHKGDLCKFSHDLIPDTKSTPCTFFARGTCLKGVDCPFDHELSKYPCHNFASEGWCSRGENCLFSHKASSATADSQIPLKPLTSSGSTPKGSVLSAKPSGFKTPPTSIPKGVCFLSFAKERLHGLTSDKNGGTRVNARELTSSEKSTLPGPSTCPSPPAKNSILVQKNEEARSDERDGGNDASKILEEFLFSGISA